MDLPLGLVPPPDAGAEPDGFLVEVEPGDRIHFLEWGGPAGSVGVVLIHGLAQTAWAWAPVARRLRSLVRVAAMDLRGHGLSDAPTDGYDSASLAADVVAVAEGAGLIGSAADRIVLAGHGFGAIVAAWAAASMGPQCAGLVLVDGGWEELEAATGMDADEFLRGIDEPPEVLASLDAFLADREAFDPGTWDADQARAARATVVETHAGHVVPATRPHALEASVRAMFAYAPQVVLPQVAGPVVALQAGPDEDGGRSTAIREASRAREAAAAGSIRMAAFPTVGHNLMRYRPVEVAAAILGQATAAGSRPPGRAEEEP